MGESLSKMAETTAETMHQMFLGDDASIELLGNIMGDGQFIASGDHDTGYVSTPSYKAQQEGKDTMDAGIIKDFYAYAIPSVWSLSGKNVFVMWTELDCGDDADLTDVRLPKDAPTVCYDGKLWAIAYPDGRAEVCTHGKEGTCHYNPFKVPDGIDDLKDGNWGGVSLEDLIVGYVHISVLFPASFAFLPILTPPKFYPHPRPKWRQARRRHDGPDQRGLAERPARGRHPHARLHDAARVQLRLRPGQLEAARRQTGRRDRLAVRHVAVAR